MPKNHILVIIDTNILISAVLKDRIPEKVISSIVANDNFLWIASEEIVEEYKAVLIRPKFNIPKSEIEKQFILIDRKTKIIKSLHPFVLYRDSNDSKFISCAIASKADYFITGDRDFSDIKGSLCTNILSVSKFAELMEIK